MSEKGGGALDKWLMNNTVARTFAFFLALMLWLVLKMEPVTSSRTGAPPPPPPQSEKTFVGLPLHVLHDEAYEIEANPQTVQLTLKGDAARIRLLTPAQLKVTVDARGLSPGTYTLSPRLTEGGTGLNWSVEPGTAQVRVLNKKQSEQNFPVEVKFLSSADKGVDQTAWLTNVQPSTVQVSGAPELVQSVESVRVEVDPLTLPKSGLLTWSDRLVPVAYDHQGKVVPVQIQPGQVTVTLIAKPSSSDTLRRDLPFSFNLLGAPRAGYTVTSWEITPNLAIVEGKKDVLEKMKSLHLGDLSVQDETQDVTRSISLAPLIPQGVTLLDPQTVTVTIHIDPLDVRAVRLPIKIVGVPPGLDSVLLNPKDATVQVELSGNRDALQSIDQLIRDGTFTATIDGRDQQEGEYTLPIKVQPPPGLLLKSVQPEQATVLFKPKDKAVIAPGDDQDGSSTGAPVDPGSSTNNDNGKKNP
ncbi:MAG: putative secreted protein associated with spyDAC [Candidatus Carbobacillus altaicus]|uniref:Putative secreted protein associated with spyDAC n=1 Tax=Candidatus Carbonibacillus altaicus TaxID=2163959 RepID=A0A2R6Y3K1_9BACL|nr:MAG: putative secreted protein associated with spyDAC [Candidatus Carbobacillus altaicus]